MFDRLALYLCDLYIIPKWSTTSACSRQKTLMVLKLGSLFGGGAVFGDGRAALLGGGRVGLECGALLLECGALLGDRATLLDN